MTPHQVSSHPNKPDGVFSPFVGDLGRPPHFDQAYANPHWAPPGRYTRGVAGTVVDRGCDEAVTDAYADDKGEVPQEAWTSLVLALKVGKQAGRARRTIVDYTVGDVAHTLRIGWTVGGKGYLRHQ